MFNTSHVRKYKTILILTKQQFLYIFVMYFTLHAKWHNLHSIYKLLARLRYHNINILHIWYFLFSKCIKYISVALNILTILTDPKILCYPQNNLNTYLLYMTEVMTAVSYMRKHLNQQKLTLHCIILHYHQSIIINVKQFSIFTCT